MTDVKKAQGFYEKFTRKGGAALQATHYCAGCGHGILNKLIAEALAELELQDKAVFVSPVGCGVFCYYYLDCGHIAGPHGRAAAVATGATRALKDKVVIAYQGDGDLGAIGFNNAFQAANRGEKFAHFFVNNAIYGMTGGQMAPTTLVGQKTATSPYGRDAVNDGYPIHVCEVFNQLEAPVYIERVSVSDTANIMKAKRAVRKALEIQRDGKGYAFVEVLCPCPTNFKMDAVAAAKWVNEVLAKEFPLGCLRDKTAQPTPKAMTWEDKSLEDFFKSEGDGIEPALRDETYRECRLKFSGFGGQGVLSMGLVVSEAAQKAQRFVSWFPSYGPEQRGGSAACSVVVSGRPIGSPTVEHIDVFVAMNQPAFERFGRDVKDGGVFIYDSIVPVSDAVRAEFLARGVRFVGVPAMKIAQDCGEPRAANTALFAVLAALDCTGMPEAVLRSSLEESFAAKPKALAVNKVVYDTAQAWLKDSKL